MPAPKHIQESGNGLVILMDDGSKIFTIPLPGGLWRVAGSPGDAPAVGTIYNPWGSSLTGTWEDHASYSAGGSDWGLAYGTNILAPSAGILHTAGGSGEFACGNVGSAGRRSILYLDTPIPRIVAKSSTLMNGSTYEGDGPMTHIVFQHQSAMGANMEYYNQGDVCGYSGASANGSDYGGDTHLHVHGLQSDGTRVDFMKFV